MTRMCPRRKMETSCKTYFMSGKIKELTKKKKKTSCKDSDMRLSFHNDLRTLEILKTLHK